MTVARRVMWILVGCLLMLSVAAEPVMAQGNQYTFNPRNLKKMVKVFDAMKAGDNATAKEILLTINLKRAKPYGRGKIYQLLGQLAAQEEPEPDYEQALDYMEKCVAENALLPEEQINTLFFVGQLQTMLGRYDDAVNTLETWIGQVEAPTPSAFYTLAVTYYQAGRAEDALKPAKEAVDRSDEPREAWYRLLLSLYLEKSDFTNALLVLDDIILAYPNKSYWQQLASIYSELDKMGTSLAVQQLAKGEGYLTDGKDLTRLAQMYMVEGLPHRGAEIMKKGLEDGSIEPSKMAYSTYSNTLLQAREWEEALEPLSKAAALENDGSLYVRMAQVNLQLGRWADARTSLNQAFDKGGLSDEGQAHILFGIAAANDKKWNTAISAFRRAQGFSGTAKVAVKWISYVEREKIRLGAN